MVPVRNAGRLRRLRPRLGILPRTHPEVGFPLAFVDADGAAGYNIFAIPLAAGLLAPWGFVLSPAIGAVLMSASTVIVAINAQLLRRVRL